ncbi:hypothetical protein BGZ73_000025 [Actinomortierella ambigua]|nr:hypothetical protein BGZ73_000025 [Actinomortierella ambigua]
MKSPSMEATSRTKVGLILLGIVAISITPSAFATGNEAAVPKGALASTADSIHNVLSPRVYYHHAATSAMGQGISKRHHLQHPRDFVSHDMYAHHTSMKKRDLGRERAVAHHHYGQLQLVSRREHESKHQHKHNEKNKKHHVNHHADRQKDGLPATDGTLTEDSVLISNGSVGAIPPLMLPFYSIQPQSPALIAPWTAEASSVSAAGYPSSLLPESSAGMSTNAVVSQITSGQRSSSDTRKARPNLGIHKGFDKRGIIFLDGDVLNPTGHVALEGVGGGGGEKEEAKDGGLAIGALGLNKQQHTHHRHHTAKEDAINGMDLANGNGGDNPVGNIQDDAKHVDVEFEDGNLGAGLNDGKKEKKHKKSRKHKQGFQAGDGLEDDVGGDSDGLGESEATSAQPVEPVIEAHKHKHGIDDGSGAAIDFGREAAGAIPASAPVPVLPDDKKDHNGKDKGKDNHAGKTPAAPQSTLEPAPAVPQAPAPQAPQAPPAAAPQPQPQAHQQPSHGNKHNGPGDRSPPPVGDKKATGRNAGDDGYGTVPMFGPAQLELSNDATRPVPRMKWVSTGAAVLTSLWIVVLMG